MLTTRDIKCGQKKHLVCMQVGMCNSNNATNEK